MQATTTTPSSSSASSSTDKSALQDNLDRKGKNAYYFAHAHKATGPVWDGKEQPKLLSKGSSSGGDTDTTTAVTATANHSFDMTQSTITTYAFLDDGPKVKLYVNLEQLGEDSISDDAIQLDYTERSLSLVIRNYYKETTTTSSNKSPDATLRIARLAGGITKASFRRKPNRIILTLHKVPTATTNEDDTVTYPTWHTLNDKGSPDHEVV